jgi:hypothetical protein
LHLIYIIIAEFWTKKPACIGVIMVNAECGAMEITEEQISGLQMVIGALQLGIIVEIIGIVELRTIVSEIVLTIIIVDQ